MIYVTGDCHANFSKFNKDNFPDQSEMTTDDIVIVCGDFGIWHDSSEERHNLNWLNTRGFTTVFVDGNHENFDRLYSNEFETVKFCGGNAHRIRDNIYHLKRGEIFKFEGKKFFAFGGARSHDIRDGIIDPEEFSSIAEFKQTVKTWSFQGKMFRVKGVSWWPEEMPSDDEMKYGRKRLSQNRKKVDYVITHCCPQEVASAMGFAGFDPLTQYFNDIAHEIEFGRWYFGHYHTNKTMFGKYVALYHKIERLL